MSFKFDNMDWEYIFDNLRTDRLYVKSYTNLFPVKCDF